METHTTVV